MLEKQEEDDWPLLSPPGWPWAGPVGPLCRRADVAPVEVEVEGTPVSATSSREMSSQGRAGRNASAANMGLSQFYRGEDVRLVSLCYTHL